MDSMITSVRRLKLTEDLVAELKALHGIVPSARRRHYIVDQGLRLQVPDMRMMLGVEDHLADATVVLQAVCQRPACGRQRAHQPPLLFDGHRRGP